MLVLGTIENSVIATIVGVTSLLLCRAVLELVYRVAFHETRLQFRTQLATFALQLLVWAFVWAWHAKRTATP